MCNDFEKIAAGDQSKSSFQKMDYRVKYPEEVASKHRKDIVRRGIYAAGEMDNERMKIQTLKIKNQKDLPIYLNK